jgi:FkbM family methyltransferase
MNRDGDSALEYIYREVVIGDCYAFSALRDRGLNVKVAVDLGASFGPATIMMSEAWPAATIYSFEADPRRFALLEENTDDLRDRVRVFNMALAGQNEGHIGWGSPWRESAAAALACTKGLGGEMRRASEVWPADVDLLKIDIEGFEWAVLEDLAAAGLLPPAIIGEWHFENCRNAIENILEPTHDFTWESTSCPWGPFTAMRRPA